MGQLRRLQDGTCVRPAARCLVGRAPACHWVLPDSNASREHAVIFYDGHDWYVRDLSSRNGTTVAGNAVRQVERLTPGAVICFGSATCAWELVDAGPPAVHATSPRRESIGATSSGLFLPSAEHCEAFVSSQDGQWVLEHDGHVRKVSPGEQLQLSDGAWTLELTLGDERPVDATSASPLPETRLLFQVSPDEEHVALTVEHAGSSHGIAHRSHNYMLLLLARARLRDQRASQLQHSEHGWLETKQLADMMRTNSEQINVWIFRARAQFHKLAPSLSDRLVERRPSSAQLRIGFGSLIIDPR